MIAYCVKIKLRKKQLFAAKAMPEKMISVASKS